MKKLLSIMLALVLLTASLTACGKAKTPADSGDNGTATETGTETGTETEEQNGEEEDSSGIDISEHVTLKVWFLGCDNVKDDTAVLEKANAYLKEKINATLEPIWGTWDAGENMVLAINGGDNVDAYFTCSWTPNDYISFAKQGAWVCLDDPSNNLIEKYAPDLLNLLPQVLIDGATISGSDGVGIYAIPGYKDIATQNCWDINVDMLEKYGYTLDDIRNTDYYGFGEILETVKQGEGKNFYPLLVEGAVLERMVTNSIIVTGDASTNNLLSYYVDPKNPANAGTYGNVMMNKFATEEYKNFVEKTREYYLAGYIDPAMGNADQANNIRVQRQDEGAYLIGTQSYALGYEHQASAERGIRVEYVPCTPAYVDTTSSIGAAFAVSTASKNPERTVMFLNLLNTDPEFMTMLNYGLEDVHYTSNDDGTVTFTEERNNYQPWTNGMGNVTILPPTDGQGPGFWDEFKAYYGAASSIPVLGFAFDNEFVTNEQGALVNLAAQYALALSTGTVDPAEKLPEFLDKLEKNGMQKYVDEANTQLEEFLKSKQ